MNKTKSSVSYILSPENVPQHRLGINSLALDPHKRLYTASRDSSVKVWNTAHSNPTLEYSFDEHTDWVNDIVICNEHTIVTASSDTTIKIWSPKESENSNETSHFKDPITLYRHTDYVKCLAFAPKATVPILASGGLDKSFYIWDLNVLKPVSEYKPLVSGTKAQKSSIYSIALSADGNILVTGSPDKEMRVWDSRSGKKIKKFIGHTDNVKSILLNEDGTLCASGSSDGSVKFWDVSNQRCIYSWSLDDAVWALEESSNFTDFYAGCRDGSVVKINSTDQTQQLLFIESHPINDLLLVEDEKLWAATTNSTLRKWNASTNTSSAKPFVEEKELYSEPIQIIEGTTGIIKYHVLNDKRRVLTMDSKNHLQIYDVVKAIKIEDLGPKDFEETIKEYNESIWVPNWFSLDSKTGSLTIHLSDPVCFSVDVYSDELGLQPPLDEESKINLGEVVLSSLFQTWKKMKTQNLLEPTPMNEVSSDSPTTSINEENTSTSPNKLLNNTPNENMETDKKSNESADDQKSPSLFNKLKNFGGKPSKASPVSEPSQESAKSQKDREENIIEECPIFPIPSNTSVILSEETTTTATRVSRFRSTVGIMENDKEMVERIDSLSPRWLSDCVLKGVFNMKESQKFSFILASENEKKIPSLPASGRRLVAPRVLKVKKIIIFIVNKLKLEETNPNDVLEILCNDQVLPLEMNLGTIKMCIWKSSADLQLVYRFQGNGNNKDKDKK